MFLYTDCKSYTGKLLYSEEIYVEVYYLGEKYPSGKCRNPILNQLARIPVIGTISGVFRAILALIHIVVHLIATVIYREKGHLYHAAKGGAEFLRGVIEAIPVIGLIFAWSYRPGSLCMKAYGSQSKGKFFLIHISPIEVLTIGPYLEI